MASACGDGWRDEAAGEACDDGNALASGGCAADCRSVNDGFTCGAGAAGCVAQAVDGGFDGGLDGRPATPKGCTSAPGLFFGASVLLIGLRHRRKRIEPDLRA